MSTEIVKSYIWHALVDRPSGPCPSIKFMSAEGSISSKLLATFQAVYDVSMSTVTNSDDESPVFDVQITSLRRVDEIYGDVGPTTSLRSGSIIRFDTDGAIIEVDRARAEKLCGLN